jgi:hypothetical protein
MKSWRWAASGSGCSRRHLQPSWPGDRLGHAGRKRNVSAAARQQGQPELAAIDGCVRQRLPRGVDAVVGQLF